MAGLGLRLASQSHHAGSSRSQNRALKPCVYDALLFRTAWSIVSQGTSWSGVHLALPGLQMTLRNGLDREDTFAVITLLNDVLGRNVQFGQALINCWVCPALQITAP